MKNFGYSSNHERSGNGKKKVTKRTMKASGPIVPKIPTTLPSFKSVLTEEERRELRARQLYGSVASKTSALQDKFLNDVQDPAPESYNQVDGKTTFPLVRGRHIDRKNRILEDDPDLNQTDPDMVASKRNYTGVSFDPNIDDHYPDPNDLFGDPNEVKKDRLGSVSIQDDYILDFDNKMTAATAAIRSLRQSAKSLLSSLGVMQTVTDKDKDAKSYATEIENIIGSAIEPWMAEVDDLLRNLVSTTTEFQVLTNEDSNQVL